jgi:RNA polymerase sigma-70 factor (ECF subfamily)
MEMNSDERRCEDEDQPGSICPDDSGEEAVLDAAFGHDRERLRKVVARRLDWQLGTRLDPSDVLQEAHLEALTRLPDYRARRPFPLRSWIMRTALQRLLKLRQHARAACRDVTREQTLNVPASSWGEGLNPGPGACEALPTARGPSPSQHVAAQERASRLQDVLRRLGEGDRAIVELRIFQGLPYEEIGRCLDIEPAAARKRYGRALLRLRTLLLAEGLTESRL